MPSLRTIRSTRDAARVFAGQPSPQIIGTGFAAMLAWRARDRRVDTTDAAIVAAIAASQGLHEWVIHRTLLHAPARTVAGHTIDTGAGHRAHHVDPDVLVDALLKPRDAAQFLPMIAAYVTAAGWPLRRNLAPRHRLTAITAAFAGLFVYEWTHYLVHTGVRLRGRYLQRRRAQHRRHHFVDERNWLGITSATGDRVFRTLPAGR
jgi:Fatty acid hydroxylase superfamily